MAHSWTQTSDEQWNVTPLIGDTWRLEEQGRLGEQGRLDEQAAWLPASAMDSDADVLLLRLESARVERWLLVANRNQRVILNGVLLQLGFCELRDRDEVLVARDPHATSDELPRRVFFSSERLAEVMPLPDGSRPVYCVRCKQLIAVGTPAVRCPSAACGLWHHQSQELPCWAYAENCAACDQLTDLNAGFRWTPENL